MSIEPKFTFEKDSIVWSWKWNEGRIPEEYCDALGEYVLDVAKSIYFSSAGFHEKGKSENPHSHVTFITPLFTMKPVTCNPTDHRKKWCIRTGRPADFFKGKVSVKIAPLDMSKPGYYPLAYPLKERNRIDPNHFTMFKYYAPQCPRPMKEDEILFLEEVGATLFEASQSKDEAREKSN